MFSRGVAAAAMMSAGSSPLDGAQILWSAVSEPVPLLLGGGADALASPSEKTPTPDLHSVFAKEFELRAEPTEARFYLFAFTRYRLYVNGVYVGRGPCRYQNQRPEYDVRDLRSVLRAGRNVIVVLVHRDAPTGRIMKHAPGFIGVLEVTDAGRRTVLRTDPTWVSMPERSFGPRAQAWSSIEEHIDARRTTDWIHPDLTAPAWKPSVATPDSGKLAFYPRSSPMQGETWLPWSAATPAFPMDLVVGEAVSLHLEQIAQVFHLLEMDALEGSELEVSYCLPDDAVSGRCTYIARGGMQQYMGGDTFACRRVQLVLKSGRVRLLHASACEMRYPFERVGSFSCSDPFLTQLWGICARSLEVLSEDSYVDCADRERVEWTDDSPPAFDCTRVMMRGPDADGKPVWSDPRLLRGLLRRIALTQQPDGQLKAHSCSERFDIHAIMEDRSCDWVVQLREYHDSAGDDALVRELWPTLQRLMLWYRERRTPRGLTLAREWEVWDNPLRYQFCEGAGLNAMVYRALTDAAMLAHTIGKVRDAQAFAAEAAQLRLDYNRLLWNEAEGAYDGALFGPGSQIRPQLGHPFTGKIVDGRFGPTAQANLFALYAGIVPAERMASVRSWILAHPEQIHEPMSCYYLFQVLYAMEAEAQDREAVRWMKTAWQNQVRSEWQTSWEELEDGGGSKVHIYGMHPAYFLSSYVLGVRREGPASRRSLRIEPRVSGLEWARGVCVTEFGPVRMEWRADAAGAPAIDCTIPDGVTATLRLRLQGASRGLLVDGRAQTPRIVDGWMEIPLEPGQHLVHSL